MSDERLRECPCCGGEAVIRYDNCNKAYIECKHGCVRTPSYWNNLAIVIKTWNTRKPMERIVERLEQMKLIRVEQCHEDYELELITEGHFDDAIEIVKGEM